MVCIQTRLQELGAITQGASFVVYHNGGYVHLASAMGAPVIALFGVVHPGVRKPLGQRDQVVYKNIECCPCYDHTRKPECYEGDLECKRVIEVDDILSCGMVKVITPSTRLQALSRLYKNNQFYGTKLAEILG